MTVPQIPAPQIQASRARYVQEKEAWARNRRGAPKAADYPAGGRIPVGQHLVRDWPILDLGTHPNIPAKDWSLSVEGLVDHAARFGYRDLALIPQTERKVDIHCVTFWSRLDMRFAGVATQDLLAEVRPRASARFALIKSYDGYTTSLPIDYLDEPDSLLATHWNGAPLERAHGGPVRLVVPALYFWKSAKWVRSIRFVDRDIKGFWESRGYHMLGDPWREQRYG